MSRDKEGYNICMETLRGHIFVDKSFAEGEVKYENGIITEVSRLDAGTLTPEEDAKYIIPGLVDIHFHGCMGVDFCDLAKETGTDTTDVLERIAEYETSVGVTTICPATMTYDEDTLVKIMRRAASYSRKAGENSGGIPAGIYLEGPFISYEKRGAQNPEYIMKPDADMVKRLNEAAGGLIRVVTVAPETEGAIDCISELSEEGFVCSIAHTTADYDTALKAVRAGADHVTHLYNAMPPFLNRAPGPVGAAFDSKSAYVELIADGVHVHPSLVRATFEMFGADRVILISDSMEATGMPDGKYSLGGQDVYKCGKCATLSDGTIAGSVTNLFDCMKCAIAMGVPKEAAILAATINPAKSVGIDGTVGSIEAGKQAKLLVCDNDMNCLDVIIVQ